MCNIAFEWDKGRKLLGVAWVVRNHRGVVICHSRRLFLEVINREEAKFASLLWAVEREFDDLFDAASRPQAWPVFGFQKQIERLLSSLKVLQDKGTGAILRRTMTSGLAI
ncbi:hypothetical protein IGI04_015751 [Brassica rapa subsp. trilocularis]|uniref:RNase H type-1 domain-containing protein n=1 Tax=Brassica rapa subsp. trilocularis TaxID=1813537 RepID=A0ABQ7MRE5_BRACM|nr:hypothetical protein IGI04_015727 [Brassica rapa subsp. trilocularis]KAG5401144.1 hypothetical protein IGI04_015751 [Brassica rapa subsp. trilocularis]